MKSAAVRLFAALCLSLAGMAFPAAAGAPAPLKITVYGGAGNIGSRIVSEAVNRGHTVVIVDRSANPPRANPKAKLAQGDVTDSAAVARQIAGQDVVISAVGGNAELYQRAAQSLVQAVRAAPGKKPRLLVVGGAGSLEASPGKLVLDSSPPFVRGELLGQKAALDYYRTVKDVEWTYLSPAITIVPGQRTGKFRLGRDNPVLDANGQGRISMEDYAIAMIDEAEKGAHVRQRFTVGY